ncbi:MAG: hypothetical protein KatS3mg129_1224 [Leptospiraceae bacterium]|nr:MAG: hypothetical protein KatS3mg129_1224 [Leptospiraceae bacterium]
MKSFFKIILNFFYPDRLIEDPVEKVFFYFDVATTNISRVITFYYVNIFGLLCILISDGIRYYNNTLDTYATELTIIHIVLLLFSISIIIISKYVVRRINNPNIFRVYFFIISLLIFFILIWITLIDQKANGQITVMIMGYFGVAVLIYLYPLDSLLLYLISTIIFLILLPYYQENKQILTSHFINIPILMLISYSISVMLFQAKVKDFIKSKKIESATAELDTLVQKVLPTQVAFKLRKENTIEPIVNENVTVVFIDFVSFSTIMEKTNPMIIFSVLDELFRKFDAILKKYNLEKIKTIGDSYMFAGGLFKEISQVKECIDASLDIIDMLNQEQTQLKYKTGYNWYVRIGIDKGKVISGIIGDWRFVFDLWGNPVNIAARLESVSLPQKINISRNVYEEIRLYKDYYFEPRGILPIKNMEPVEMFFVDRAKKMLSSID